MNVKSGSLFALALLIVGCSQGGEPSPGNPPGAALRRGLGGEPESLDPAESTDTFSSQVLQDLYEGLTDESATGDVVPGVASSWTIDSSGTQYKFKLRSNARWSNGEAVRAQDFVAAWQRVLDPKRGSPVANDLRLVKGAAEIIAGRSPVSTLGVVAETSDLLVVNLEQPAPYFVQLLSHSSAFPIFSDSTARTHDARTWVSNGPYVLSVWRPGSGVELTRNQHYWNASNVRIESVKYQFAPDPNSQFAAYRAGQLDMTDNVPANAIVMLRKEHPDEIVISPYLATAYYAFNLKEKPFAGNPKLRKALAMAIDRRRVVDSLALGQTPAYGFVPPNVWNYALQHWDWDSLSDEDRVAEAKKLYKQAGYSTDTPLNLRLLFNSNPVIKQTAIMIAAMWKETLGVNTDLSEEEFRVYLQSRHETTNWEVVREAWNADYNDATSFLNVLRKSAPNNDSGYVNASFEQLLDKAGNTANADIRRELLQTSERIMLSDYPIVPLYYYVSKRLVKPYVLGVKPNPLDRVESKDLSLLPQ